MHILKRIAARLIAYGLLFGGAACNLWGCTEVISHPERSEAGSWLVFLGFVSVLIAACWIYRLREEVPRI